MSADAEENFHKTAIGLTNIRNTCWQWRTVTFQVRHAMMTSLVSKFSSILILTDS